MPKGVGYGSDMKTAKPPAKSKGSTKLTDKQKADLKRHMEKHKDLQDLTPSQLKSHRMKMMAQMRKGHSLAKAHKAIMGK